jgi:hypothetical protein
MEPDRDGLRQAQSSLASRRRQDLRVFAPQANTARKYVATSLAQLGRSDEARAEIAKLLKQHPGVSIAVFEGTSPPQVDEGGIGPPSNRLLGVEDALEIAEKIEVEIPGQSCRALPSNATGR